MSTVPNTPDLSQLPSANDQKNDIIEYMRLRLAGDLVDVELDKAHYDLAVKQALMRYRQRASNAVEESYCFLDLIEDTQEYILPKEITTVRQVFRRGTGSVTGNTASQFEPFSSGFLNTYMLVSGRVGGLASYELFTSYQKQTMTMFGGYINFAFNPATKKLTIVRKIPASGESVLLWTYNYKPDQVLLADDKIYPWIQDYAYAMGKHMVGEAREKFATIAGPQGGTTLNGSALKAEAKAEMDQLIIDLTTYTDGSIPYTWIVG